MASETRFQTKAPAPQQPGSLGFQSKPAGVSFVPGPRRRLTVGGRDPFSPLFLHLALALPFLQQLRAHTLLWLSLAEPWLSSFW